MASFAIHTSLLFDPSTKSFIRNCSVTVNPKTGLIVALTERKTAKPTLEPADIDLTHLPLIIPGLVDAHTHIFLHPYSEAPALIQMRDESPTERTIRAVNHVRTALLAGYTTYRDLGTEAMANDDVGVRDAINRGLIPGPRIYAATLPIASSGGYDVRTENSQTRMPVLSDVADGVDGVRAAVRRRLGMGADVVKVYTDYRRRTMRFPGSLCAHGPDIQFPPTAGPGQLNEEPQNPSLPLWSQEELNAIVDEANRVGCPVAAHCGGNEAVVMAAKAKVCTIEHGSRADRETLQVVKENGCIFVPTLAVLEIFVSGEAMKSVLQRTKMAFDMGIKLACGGDTGAFAHGDNAREIELMMKAEVPLEEVLYAATIGGWQACGGMRCGRKFGSWEVGCAADVVGLGMDPREDGTAFRAVEFVMKDAKVWKQDGKVVGMV
ncbi:hypothetical protein MMC19_003673 [Ptychographa xylographoides]|nr:hypothetical protein [Ptychographa xylographoides]